MKSRPKNILEVVAGIEQVALEGIHLPRISHFLRRIVIEDEGDGISLNGRVIGSSTRTIPCTPCKRKGCGHRFAEFVAHTSFSSSNRRAASLVAITVCARSEGQATEV